MDVGRSTADIEESGYDPGHEHTTVDGAPVIIAADGTVLYESLHMIRRRWDVSVVNDLVVDSGYAVCTSVDCGGGVLVYATVFIQQGAIHRLDTGHTSLLDGDDDVTVDHLNPSEPSRVLTHVNRFYERSVMNAYANTITSAATAFDYIATRADIPPEGRRTRRNRSRRQSVSQREWAALRGKTEATVSGNVRKARADLRDGREQRDFTQRGPCLDQLDPDGDERGRIYLA
jgi:hypothetical protein